jgi:hypothetical protein
MTWQILVMHEDIKNTQLPSIFIIKLKTFLIEFSSQDKQNKQKKNTISSRLLKIEPTFWSHTTVLQRSIRHRGASVIAAFFQTYLLIIHILNFQTKVVMCGNDGEHCVTLM